MLAQLLNQLQTGQQRQLLRLVGTRHELTQWLNNELAQLPDKHVIYFGHEQTTETKSEKTGTSYFDARLKHYQKYLGTESDVVIFDCYAGLNPDALGALTGTIKQGGLCILLTPTDQTWLSYPDPDLQRICAHPYRISDAYNLYIARFIKELHRLDSVRQYQILEQTPHLYTVDKSVYTTNQLPQYNNTVPQQSWSQRDAVETIRQFSTAQNATNDLSGCIVLQADRGRGKTAALGLAAAELLISACAQTKSYNIIICAPIAAAIQTLFKHARQRFDEQGLMYQQVNSHKLHVVKNASLNLSISFIAPDVLSLTLPDADLVMIDEAAAIPIQLLKPVIEHYKKQIYATTVKGYEGTGRGFEYKLKPLLKAVCNHYQPLLLTQPIRWQNDDYLEQAINRLLALDLTLPPSEKPPTSTANAPYKFTIHDHKVTDDNTQAYEQAFALLTNAHYRTTPNDLRYMLDAPNVQLMSLSDNQHLLAAALVVTEGNLTPELSQQIWQGRRRPRGNLFPQSLLAHSGFSDAGDYKYARVVRIAVNPTNQGQGLGSYLLKQIKKHLQQRQYDFLCTSFGYWHKLYNFWRANEFTPVRLGIKAEASTGEYSIFMSQPLSDKAQSFSLDLHKRFQQTLAIEQVYNMPAAIQFGQDLNSGCIAQFSTQYPAEKILNQHDLSDLQAFAEHHRTFDSCLLAMTRFFQQNQALLSHLSQQQKSLLVDSMQPTITKKQLIDQHQLSGEKQLIQQLRLIWQCLLKFA